MGDEREFQQAIERYTEAITLNRNNHLLFSDRSAAYARVGRFAEALEDANRCHELKPDWPKAYYRLGIALQGLGKYEDAIVAFAEGLAADPKYSSMLNGLTETMLRSPLRAVFQPKLEKFEGLKLDKDPFIITSLIGQELQTAGKLVPAMKVLEAAFSVGTESLKLEASLMQALGRVHWALGNSDRALGYMEKDLSISDTLGDAQGCLRARDNLGTAYFSVHRYHEAASHHSAQLQLAQSLGDAKEMVNALTRFGNSVAKQGNYAQAINAYKDSLKIAKDLDDQSSVYRAFMNLGETYLASGDSDKAIVWHRKHLAYAKEYKNKPEEAQAYALLGQACFSKANYDQSMMFYQQLLSVAVQMNNMELKAKAYGGMGQANRAMGNLWHAQSCREQQLKLCKDMGYQEGEMVALSQLGHLHKASGKLHLAMQCYSDSLALAQKLKDRAGEGRAYANLGSCHVSLGNFREAVNYYQQELGIAQETKDVGSEATTLGHLGTAYLALDNLEMALDHLHHSLQLAQDVKNKQVECQALSNLGAYHTNTKEYPEALPYLEKGLKLAQELKDSATESKVCHNLGLCHEALGHYQQAIQYYQHDLLVAKEAQDRDGMTQACKKLIKAHNEIGDREQADIYQRKLLSMAEEIQNTSGKCSFWNHVAEDLLNSGDYDRAIEFYENLLKEAKKEQHQSFEGLAYCGLGNAYLSRGDFDHALSYHRRDLQLRKAVSDLTGECNAYANMGAAHNSMNQHQHAVDCYEHQLTLAKQLDNPILVTKAYGCLGIVHRNMKNFKKALHYHQLQLSTALHLKENTAQQANAYANLGDTYEAVGDYQKAIANHEHNLVLAQRAQNAIMEIRALSSLGRAHRGLGNLTHALQYFLQQLKLANSMSDEYTEAECYADIGGINMLLGDYGSALDAFSHQLQLARSLEDSFSEALAACGLGEVHIRLGNYQEAVDYHKLDLRISISHGLRDGEARALGDIAQTYETIGEYKYAIEYREKQLSVAELLGDNFTKALAFIGLGKIHIKLNDVLRSVTLLKQALSLIVDQSAQEQTQVEIEVEAKIRFYLGQAFYLQGHYEPSLVCLQNALPLFEHMRQNVGSFDHGTKQTLELHPLLFQTLINVLVRLNKVEEALEAAEMERNRATTDALIGKEVQRSDLRECGLLKSYSQASSIQETIDTMHCPVLYFSVALSHIYIWLLHPKSGIVQFQKVDMSEFGLPGSDSASVFSESSSSYVQPLVETVASLRESLGVQHCSSRLAAKSMSSSISDELDSGEDSESLGSSNGTLGLLTSPSQRQEMLAGGKASPGRSINMQPVHELYDLLIRPLEYVLPRPPSPSSCAGQLVIVPDKELYLVPFALLRGEGSHTCLYQRFQIHMAPSLLSLAPSSSSTSFPKHNLPSSSSSRLHPPASSNHHRPPSPISSSSSSIQTPSPSSSISTTLIVGNPTLPPAVAQVSGWQSMAASEKECRLIAEMLGVRPLLGPGATKTRLLQRLASADIIHLATNVSWDSLQIMLSLQDEGGEAPGARFNNNEREGGDGKALQVGGGGGRRGEGDGAASVVPEPQEYLLSVGDVLSVKLRAKLVVLSSCLKSSRSRITAKGLRDMAQAFLAAGAECVVLPLWLSSFQASRLMMNAFYSSLCIGSRTSRALSYAMQVVHSSGKHCHPSNWSGYALFGHDTVVKDRSKDLARSIRSMLQAPLDYLIAALKILQAMIVSSLKHLSHKDGVVEPKYTARQAVESKVGMVPGWEEVLSCTGFHFISQIKKDIPATIVFPDHDDSGLQKKCQRHLEALLGVPPTCLKALGALSKHPSAARPVLEILRSAKLAVDSPERGTRFTLEREVWGCSGCQDLLLKLNFGLLELHSSAGGSSPWVQLGAPVGVLDGRVLHFAITSVIAVFGPEDLMEVPRHRKLRPAETSGPL